MTKKSRPSRESNRGTGKRASRPAKKRAASDMKRVADEHPSLPDEYRDFLVADAERSADRVMAWLNHFGISRTVALPAELLIGFDLALRFETWEQNSISEHLKAGLPSALQVMKRVLSLMEVSELQAYVDRLGLQVIIVQRESLAWQAGGALGADVAIVADDDEDAFLDTMADFLWDNRHNSKRRENK